MRQSAQEESSALPYPAVTHRADFIDSLAQATTFGPSIGSMSMSFGRTNGACLRTTSRAISTCIRHLSLKGACPIGNVHRIKGEEPPGQAADAYEAALRQFFGESIFPAFDLILLGIGEDGHTASLFPGSPALAEQERLAVAVAPKQPPYVNRVTLTLPVLNNALHTIFLVSDSAKAHTLQEILTGAETSRNYPAALVNSASGNLTWLIDAAAAALLSRQRRWGTQEDRDAVCRTTQMTYDEVNRVFSRWKPFGGLVYFHLLLSGLAEKGLIKA